MKMIKGSILGLSILTAGLFQAQEAAPAAKLSMTNMIKVGASVGIAVPSENASAAAGVDIAYQNLVTPGFGLGIATGYTHYFGKENNGLDNNDFGVIPVAALVRIYPKDTGFYLGSNLGYGFIVGDDQVASNALAERPTGGFYIKPEIGYHNNDWNFSVHYEKTFTGDDGAIGSQKYSAGSIGVGVGYNIPLGK